MDEAEDFLAGDLFGDRDDSDSKRHDENAPSTDEQLLNDLFKEGDKRRVVPKRKILHPQPKFREQELCGPKGFLKLKKMFDNYKPNPRKDPYANLVDIMNSVEYWAHLLYPKLKFDDFIARVETLGEKRMVKTYMQKMRLDMPLIDEDFVIPSKQNASLVGESDERSSERDGNGIITKPIDNDLDDFVDQFYNDPTSVLVSAKLKETTNSRPLELTEAQRQRIAENKRRAEEIRMKREAFLNRVNIWPREVKTSEQRTNCKDIVAQDSTSQQPLHAVAERNDSEMMDMMDDDDALNFIFSSE